MDMFLSQIRMTTMPEYFSEANYINLISAFFRTRSLEKASPAFCSQCALCPVQDPGIEVLCDMETVLSINVCRSDGQTVGKTSQLVLTSRREPVRFCRCRVLR